MLGLALLTQCLCIHTPETGRYPNDSPSRLTCRVVPENEPAQDRSPPCRAHLDSRKPVGGSTPSEFAEGAK